MTSFFGEVGFGLLNNPQNLLIPLVLSQVEPLEALELIPGLHNLFLQFCELLLLLLEQQLLILNLPLQPLIAFL